MSVYRSGPPPAALACPRCSKRLPPLDVAACACGTWLTAFAAGEVLTDEERRADPVTRWWRVRAPCPMCGVKMVLRGSEPGLFQGCDGHGFWIDADTIEHTSLAKGVDAEALDRKRMDSAAMEAEQEGRERAELARATEHAEKAEAESRLRKALGERDAQRVAEDAALRAAFEAERAASGQEPPVGPLDGEPGGQARVSYLLEREKRLEAQVAALEATIAALEARVSALENRLAWSG